MGQSCSSETTSKNKYSTGNQDTLDPWNGTSDWVYHRYWKEVGSSGNRFPMCWGKRSAEPTQGWLIEPGNPSSQDWLGNIDMHEECINICLLGAFPLAAFARIFATCDGALVKPPVVVVPWRSFPQVRLSKSELVVFKFTMVVTIITMV
jgi:hypothetical protein